MSDATGSAGENKGNEEATTVSNVYSIFILKIKNDSLKQAETFLRNRNWVVGTGVNLREALAYIIQKKPEFVMIAADHPNKKVKILPRLLAQAFPVKLIVFAEAQGGHSISSLHEMGAEYTLFPPVSGPSIERIVLKMKRDEEKRAQEQKERAARGETDAADGGVIRLKGESGEPGENGSSFEQARAALNQLISSGGDDHGEDGALGGMGGFAAGGTSSAGHDPQNPGTFVNKGGPSSAGQAGMAYMGQLGEAYQSPGAAAARGDLPAHLDQAPRDGESFADWEERTRAALAGMMNQEGANNDSMSAGGGAGFGPGGSAGGGPGFGGAGFSGAGIAAGASDWSGLGEKPEPPVPNFDGPNADSRRKQAPIMESEYVPKKKKLEPRYKNGPAWRGETDLESIIIKGTQAALDESVKVREDLEQYQEIEKASHCACIIVESEKFSGYLVAALGKNRKVDKDFIEQVKKRLFSFLKTHGEIVKEEDSMQVKLEEVAFEDWALEQADFLRKSIHDGDEIAMAFFPTKDTTIKLEESASSKMLMMDISELKEDTAVEFDLYIYMPENNKYLLYTPQGRPLYGTQRNRLTDKGVTKMHLRKESAGNVKKYRAQNYLNEKIQSFKAKKAP